MNAKNADRVANRIGRIIAEQPVDDTIQALSTCMVLALATLCEDCRQQQAACISAQLLALANEAIDAAAEDNLEPPPGCGHRRLQ
jgi:hypothetical protein